MKIEIAFIPGKMVRYIEIPDCINVEHMFHRHISFFFLKEFLICIFKEEFYKIVVQLSKEKLNFPMNFLHFKTNS